MAIQFSSTVRDAQNNSIETTIGTSPYIFIATGSVPANTSTADSGTTLVNYQLPSDWMSASSGGVMTKAGTWSGTASGGSGATPGYFRIKASNNTTVHMQGTAGIGSGDMSFDGTITSGQTVTISTFTLTAGGA
jgi:hypothetical protein